ncbi:LOW QUALITY PROTEIN: phospholipase A1-Igamma3, chloroplastic [Mercurialis annua]|uniref:LOW QUALITY PROTEIN: phospholipase A1-Igamma3, chloroplastic n=1 Tax=Mercurialis annua TaxID=3986 RepID=UPI00215FF27D|nr:LOW QUALITY PROTEIN: phospholipase A1-Igamma3, chloroplastic [Mercurialis annua]
MASLHVHLPTVYPNFLPTYTLNKSITFFASKLLLPNPRNILSKCYSSSLSSLTPHMDETLIISQEDDKPLSEIWKEIQGCNDWEGLLDTMNSHLRKEIIRYGEFAQACYDSFDFDPHSKYCGTSKYQGPHFFEKLGMHGIGYQISRFLYATSNINLPNFFQKSKLTSVWSTHANWMGYVAVTTDEAEIKRLGRRDIVIAWRGTVTYLEWIHDLKDILCSPNFINDPSIKIESGFHDLYTKKEDSCKYCTFSAREQVLAEIKRLIDYYRDEELSITITGHSLGAALAILSAYDIAEMKLNFMEDQKTEIPITVYSFSALELEISNLKRDAMNLTLSYAHVGVELALDHRQSPFLKATNNLGNAHNLELHLHLVDGYHGKGRPFCLATKRDIALVNKSCDLLRGEYGVPPHWRQDENKGMVRDGDGRWVVPERPLVEAHPEDTAHHLEQVLKNNAANSCQD